ncbi:hypothetical protein HK405_003275, partial [Cladochytrium tenue]
MNLSLQAADLQSRIVELEAEKKALKARMSALEVKEKALEAEKTDLEEILTKPKDRWAGINVGVQKAMYGGSIRTWIKKSGTKLKQINSELMTLWQERKNLQELKLALLKKKFFIHGQLFHQENDLSRLSQVQNRQ